MSSEIEMQSAAQRQAQRLNELQDEEESSLLDNENGLARRDISRSSIDMLADNGPSSSGSLSDDLAVCSSAWNMLSCPTRFILLLAVVVILMFSTYEYGMGEGMKKHERNNAMHSGGSSAGDGKSDGSSTSSKEDKHSNPDREEALETVPSATQTTFTREILMNIRAKAMELVGVLDEYYGGEEQAQSMLIKSWQAQWLLDDHTTYEDISDGDEDKRRRVKEGKVLNDPKDMSAKELEEYHNNKRKRTKKLVETMARSILNPSQTRFIIGTIGSSVAAGHDNCHYDSYESQLERTLGPVFSAANMNFIVQNAGEGGSCGDSHQNQVFCITPNVSPDTGAQVTHTHYSWTYFGSGEEAREQLIRWAQRMERRPMVHQMVAGGSKSTCGGDDQANVNLDETYAIYGFNAFCIQTGLYYGGHDYEAEKEHGLNRFGYQVQGDGYHNTTRYGEALSDDDPRKISLGTVYRNWHPGPLGFQIASDAFAYVYTKGLLMALDAIEKDMINTVNLMDRWFDTGRRLKSTERQGKGPSRQLETVPTPSEPTDRRQLYQLPPLGNMPEPLFCDPRYCSTTHPPFCLNYEKPSYGTPGIITQTESDWKLHHDPNKWFYMVGKVDTAIVKALHDKGWEQKCAHLDACGGISAEDSRNGPLVYELPSSNMTAGLVFVCGGIGKIGAESMFLNNQNVTFKLNGHELDKSKMDVFPNGKCVRLLEQFGDDGYHKEDKMLLTVEMAEQPPDLPYRERPYVKISHVVAL